MKFKHCIPALLILFLLGACSNEDDDFGSPTPIETATDYLPTTVGNHWDYDNTIDIPDQYHHESEERLSVTDSTTESATPSYLFSSNVGIQDQGVMTVLLTHGKLNKVEGSIIFNGAILLQIPVIDESISIPVHNLFLLDQNEDSDQRLSSITDTLTHTLNFSGQSLPVNFKYTIKTTAGDSFETYNAGDKTYDDVISSSLSIKLSADAQLPMGFNLELLTEQTVLESTNYFAKNIGMILGDNTITMEFEDLSEYNVPQIPPIDGTSAQVLADYSVQ